MSLDTKQLAALAEILRQGSFEAAAAALGVTQSAISQRLKALEDSFGCILVERSTPCRGTAAGLRLAAHADAVALMEADLARSLGLGGPRSHSSQRVRIAVNADSLATWLPAALDDTGQFSFELMVDDETVSADWLRRGEVMAAVTTQQSPVQGCNVHKLGAMRYVATAAPEFIHKWLPDGATPAAMAMAPMLRFSLNDALQPNWLKRHIGAGLHPPVHFVPSTTGFVQATLAGLGWALNPESLVAEHLARGTLVELKPDSRLDTGLYWQVSRILAPALAEVTDKLCHTAKRALEPLTAQRP